MLARLTCQVVTLQVKVKMVHFEIEPSSRKLRLYLSVEIEQNIGNGYANSYYPARIDNKRGHVSESSHSGKTPLLLFSTGEVHDLDQDYQQKEPEHPYAGQYHMGNEQRIFERAFMIFTTKVAGAAQNGHDHIHCQSGPDPYDCRDVKSFLD